MSKKTSIIIVALIIAISLIISIYIPNKDKIENEKEDITINYSTIEENGRIGVAEGDKTIINPQYDKILIPNQHRAVFMCQNGEDKKSVNEKNEEIFKDYDTVELIEYDEAEYEKNKYDCWKHLFASRL